MYPESPDDLDRLYTKLEWENPRANLAGRVLARVYAAQRVQRVSAVLSLVALTALGVGAFALGRGLSVSGTLDYLALLINNLDVAADAADDFVSALLDVMPWTEVIAVLLGMVGLWLTSVALPRFWANRRSSSS
ncbi:MAG: hypothetical protein ABI874_00045 [Chloroflexota bacterium]